MNISLISNLTREKALTVSLDVLKELERLDLPVAVPSRQRDFFPDTAAIFMEQNELIDWCDLMICVGGDGTIIHTAKYGKPVLGINAGRLAFMAGLESDELSLLEKLCGKKYEIDSRMMLDVSIFENGMEMYFERCVNDVVVGRNDRMQIVEIDVECNSNHINNYLADGIILSTPTGSTAYSLSAGGPVVDPSIDCIILTPICTHSLFSRSIIFEDSSVLKVKSKAQDELKVTIDGGTSYVVSSGAEVVIRRSQKTADFIRIKNDAFYNILNNKLAQRRA